MGVRQNTHRTGHTRMKRKGKKGVYDSEKGLIQNLVFRHIHPKDTRRKDRGTESANSTVIQQDSKSDGERTLNCKRYETGGLMKSTGKKVKEYAGGGETQSRPDRKHSRHRKPKTGMSLEGVA